MTLLSSLGSLADEALRRAVIEPVGPTPLDPEELFRPRPMAMYVHVPFCGATCSYCAFNKYRRPAAEVDAYMQALRREVATHAARPELGGVRVSSLYIGGGTPSFVPAAAVAELLETIRGGFRLVEDIQITLEANPESVTAAKLEQYVAAGVNRLSLGAQSFEERQLRRLGRRHDAAQIRRALRLVRQAGIDEVNVDLMYGLPGQNLTDFAADLREALSTGATHLSIFGLCYQPGTPLARERPGYRPLLAMYEHALQTLSDAGFRQYTTEDFTRSAPCTYNVDVWRPPPTDCLGLGAGALSTFAGTNWHNVGSLDRYLELVGAGRAPVAGGLPVSTRQQMVDHLLISTKTLSFDPALFRRRFGVGVERVLGLGVLWAGVARLAGLARAAGDGTVELTPRGRFVASRVWSSFILGKLGRAAGEGDEAAPGGGSG